MEPTRLLTWTGCWNTYRDWYFTIRSPRYQRTILTVDLAAYKMIPYQMLYLNVFGRTSVRTWKRG